MTEALPECLSPPTPLPANEVGRLRALRRYNILDTPHEVAFDRITALAARLFGMPIALVSLIDESRGWFKSAYGFDLEEVRRGDTICSLALLSSEVLVIPDTRQDDRLTGNPFVQNEPGLRFYVGAPLLTQDGFNLGTLCLLDTEPHDAFTDEQQAILSDLAAIVVDELELRLANYKVTQIDTALLEVTQAVSATTGEAFFYALVQHFAKTLGVDYAYIGLVQGSNQDAIRTIAACAQGQIIENFEYLLRDTPCQEVIQQRKLCSYPNGVQVQFPQAPLLEPLGVESYIAIPFFDSTGKPLGLLSIMDRQPLNNIHLAEALLTVFALRIAAELERQQTEYQLEHLVAQRTAELSQANKHLQLEISERQQTQIVLQREQETLRVLLDNVQAGIVACNAAGILTLFNRAAREFHGLPEQPLPPDQWAEYYDLYMPDGKTRMSKAEIPLFRALQGEAVYNAEMVISSKQGTTRTLIASGQSIVDAQGKLQGAVVVMHDITERKQAESELLLSDVALKQMPDAILLTDLEAKIQRWLGNAEQIFGYTAAEAIGQPVNFLHHSDIKTEMTAQMLQSIQATGEFRGEISCLRKDGSTVPIETTAKTVYDKAGNPQFFIGINKDITERKQTEAEREQLMRQQVQEQTARLEAEANLQRSSFLVEISTALTASLDYEQTLQSVASLAVPYFADWCCVDLLNDDCTISRVAIAHSDPEKVQLGWDLMQRFPKHLDDGYGISQVMKTGQSEITIEITDEQLTAATSDAEYLEILRGVGLKSCIIAPLQARGRVLGSVSFVFAESNRQYCTDDLRLAEDLAHRAGIAIDNARLYHAAQQAKQAAETAANRTARLQMVTAALSKPLTPEQVVEVIVEQSMAALAATAALVVLVSKDRTELEIVKSIGYQADLVESWHRFSINADVPLAEAIRTGEPAWVETLLDRIARYPHLAEVYRRYDFDSWLALPFVVQGRSVGGMLLSFKEFKQLSQDDREFVLALCRQCAQAVSRAQLYEAERKAREEAEQANRIKDEFLAVLSHELRSPLNPILGWSRLLQTGSLDATKTAYALATIERNAKLQTELIEDLLDVSRILQGKLSLNPSPVNLAATIQAGLETVRLAAEAKVIQIETQLDLEVGQVLGDAARLQQVVWNLFSNAVKFTPDGGRVEIVLNRSQDYAQITVRDTGKGIDPKFLPHVFDYFRQEDGATTRKFGGLGLGLAIVRHLVELHGGTVRAESQGEGLGATFIVQLPIMQQSLPIVPEPTRAQADSERPLDNLHILVVDDDTDTREFQAFLLEQNGAKVTAVTCGLEALQALEQFVPDVIVSDVGMADMDGYMLMQQIRSREALPSDSHSLSPGGRIPAIALTAYAAEVDQQKALQAGFQAHLTKPVEPETLVRAIVNLISHN